MHEIYNSIDQNRIESTPLILGDNTMLSISLGTKSSWILAGHSDRVLNADDLQ